MEERSQTANKRSILDKVKTYSVYRSTIILLLIAVGLGLLTISNPVAEIFSIAVCLVSSVIADAAIFYTLNKKFRISENAIITALIIGSILSANAGIAILALLNIIAIASKHFLKHEGFPIFNPAALAIVIAGLAFGFYGEWWASEERVFLIFAALLLAWKLNKFAMEIAFAGTWIAFHLAGIFLYEGTLTHSVLLVPAYFMAFMLLEPKTSPAKINRQIIYGGFAALLAAATFSFPLTVDNLALALLLANLLNKAMSIAKI